MTWCRKRMQNLSPQFQSLFTNIRRKEQVRIFFHIQFFTFLACRWFFCEFYFLFHWIQNYHRFFVFERIGEQKKKLVLLRAKILFVYDKFYVVDWSKSLQCGKSFVPGSLPGTAAAHELVVAIRRKCTNEEVLTVLNTLPGQGENEEPNSFNPLKIDVFVQTLLNLGSKSFSHSFAAIGKFHYVFKVISSISYSFVLKLSELFFFV